jgi:hypothetical protein
MSFTGEASRAIVAMVQTWEEMATRRTRSRLDEIPVDIRAQVKQSLRVFDGLAMGLAHCEPIYLAPGPIELIVAGSVSLPEWPLRHVDLPVPHAFIHLSWPLPLIDERHPGLVLYAISYYLTHFETGPDRMIPNSSFNQATGIQICWHLKGRGINNLDEMFSTWRFGVLSPHSFPVAIQEPELDTYLIRFFRSCLAFMQQRILVKERASGDRASRKQSEHAGFAERPCLIILLRKAKTSASSEIGAPEWSCRWYVSGHWRQQAYGKKRINRRPTWVSPYIKGPEDKPIRASKRLFAVVR